MVKKTASNKKPTSKAPKKISLYSNLAYKHRVKADARSRKKAEDLATLPKQPVKRFFAKLHPKRVFKYWFSREGLFRFLKIIAALILICIIIVGGLFLYFKKEAEACGNISDQVTDTVNTYLDRNGVTLWEDKGDGDYRLTVPGEEISSYMRQATVAREDKNFYNHIGVDFTALIRAAWMTLSGQSVQGGSTLTQQLVKQVCFAAEASNRDLSGIPRKIKEVIVAFEVEKMYDKEQIITMYLNESPYGGRRNGVESGAQTYFGKSSKDLTLAEAALLAAIPNNPARLNPYNFEYNDDLIRWQHFTLDTMVEMNYITKQQADEAKAVPILDQILPEESQYKDIKAPWFVLEVKKQLEEKYGVGTIRAGGFTITTTLDYRAQEFAERAIDNGEKMFSVNRVDNATLVSVDVDTSQVIAMAGSIDWNVPVYGQVNAATSLLEPGSSIKPVLDYAPLFMERTGQNWGPGSILRDENIDSIYCRGYVGKCTVQNATGGTYGDVTIRQALGNSLNRPAVKALYINGIDNSLETLHKLGDVSYCAHGENAGLSMSIGGGCRVRPVEHANTYASVARGGSFKPLVYWLEVKNGSGDVIDRWENVPGEHVIDEQIAYMINDILSDPNARRLVFNSIATSYGFRIPGVFTASKTGTTDNGANKAKDSFIASYSPVLSTIVWSGNHDGSPLANDSNSIVRRIANDFMEPAHKQIYGPEGKWVADQKFNRPAGLQTLTVNGRTDIWPSWYNERTSGIERTKIIIDTFSLALATSCTPNSTRREITISRSVDPMTKKEIFTVDFTDDPVVTETIINNWKNEVSDDRHSCNDAKPAVTISIFPATPIGDAFSLSATVTSGTFPGVDSYDIIATDGEVINKSISGNTITFTVSASTSSVRVVVRDSGGYEAESTQTNPNPVTSGDSATQP